MLANEIKRVQACMDARGHHFQQLLLVHSDFPKHTLYAIFTFAPYVNSIKALFILPTDAHYYKIIGMLIRVKFRQLLRHVSVHAGTIIRELFRA